MPAGEGGEEEEGDEGEDYGNDTTSVSISVYPPSGKAGPIGTTEKEETYIK